MTIEAVSATRVVCAQCGAEMPATFLACPACHWLAHADALKRLAGQAERAEAAGDLSAALAAWRSALELIPPGATQHHRIAEKVAGLSTRVGEGAATAPAGAAAATAPGGRAKWIAGLGVVGVMLFKFKWLVLLLLSKGKLLLVGLTQAKTFLTMILAIGVYATAWGWKFALGLVLSIYVHEMGHVAALRRYGIPATAPMFIPGLGAFVRLKQHPATPGQDARVGLAGPVWGLAAALVCLAVGLGNDWPLWVAIARVGAWINLFNLLPIWQLDGGRGFAALSRRQRGWVAAGLWIVALFGVDGVLFVLAAAATVRALGRQAPEAGDSAMFWLYLGLVTALTTLMAWAPIALPGR